MTAATSVPVPACSVLWCRNHHAEGCLGSPVTLAGTELTVWLAEGPEGTVVLVIDGREATVEVPVSP
jgi:hypothetical protein